MCSGPQAAERLAPATWSRHGAGQRHLYFVHALGLLDYRLMLLAELVDERAWSIRYSHPPTLHRVFNLLQAGETVAPGGAAGLKKLHGDSRNARRPHRGGG